MIMLTQMMIIVNTMKSDFCFRSFPCRVVSASIVFQALTIRQFHYTAKHDIIMSSKRMNDLNINEFTEDLCPQLVPPKSIFCDTVSRDFRLTTSGIEGDRALGRHLIKIMGQQRA